MVEYALCIFFADFRGIESVVVVVIIVNILGNIISNVKMC